MSLCPSAATARRPRPLRRRSERRGGTRQAAASACRILAPPSVLNGITDARASIARCKAALSAWGVAVQDYPDDQAPDAPGHPGSSTVHHLRPPVSDFVGHEQTVDHLVTTLHTMADAGR